MELIVVGDELFVAVAFPRPFLQRQQVAEPLDRGRIGAARRQPDGLDLERAPDHAALLELQAVYERDEGARLRLDGDESLVGKLPQGVAHWCAGDAELVRDLLLD